MSDLFTMLGVASRALDAQRYALDVSGQNIANVNTPGYVRRSVQFAEARPTDALSSGNGVDVVGVLAARAPLLESRIRFEEPAEAREGAIADHLGIVETGLGLPGQSLDAALARFYNQYGALAQSPTSSSVRKQVIIEGQSLAREFNSMAGQFATAGHSADGEVRDTITQVNALARQLADLNQAIGGAGTANVEGLLDQQAVVLGSISALIDIGVVQGSDGTVNVTVGNGRALVVGADTYDLSLVSNPPNGYAGITSSGAAVMTDITSEITGGRIAGLLDVRDVLIPGYANQLDQMAFAVATDVNALAGTGFDLTGSAGVDFFMQPVGLTGAAQQMAVRAAVAADTNLVVAAGTPAAGNNDIARAIAALQDQGMGGGSVRPVDAWGTLVYSVAADAKVAQQARAGHGQIVQQLRNLRDQISGVSLDEEAATLLKFQRAYEANARFFQVTDATLDLLMQLVRT